MQQTNTTGPTTTHEFSFEYAGFLRLPAYLREFAMFEAPTNLNSYNLLDEFDRRMQSSDVFFNGKTADDVWLGLFSDLKQVIRDETLDFYGKEYPFGKSKKWVRQPLDRQRRRVV